MAFELETFKTDPTPTLLQQAKKADLLEVATHYGVEEVKQAMRKQKVLNILVEYFINEDIFDEAEASPLIKNVEISGTADLQFQLEMKKLELQKEKEIEERKLQKEIQE